jgi:hypothetical protein
MKPTHAAALAAILTLSLAANAQMDHSAMGHGPTAAPTPGPAPEVLRSYTTLKGNVIKAAEKMPADAYQYKPVPDIRTYARVVNHITEAQSRTCTALLGEKFEASMVPADTADKEAIVAGLKASFDRCDKAYAALTDASSAEVITTFMGKRSRIGMAWGNVSHDNEQYAILSLYLRFKGLVPPTSEK